MLELRSSIISQKVDFFISFYVGSGAQFRFRKASPYGTNMNRRLRCGIDSLKESIPWNGIEIFISLRLTFYGQWVTLMQTWFLPLTPFLLGSYSVPSCHRLTAEVAILGGDVRGEPGWDGWQPGGGAAASGRIPCRQVLTPSPASTSPGCRVADPHWFNADPDPGSGVWCPKVEKNLQLEI